MKKNYTILIISSVLALLAAGVIFFILKKPKRQTNKFIQTLIKTAKGELNKWQGVQELSQKMSQTLVEYWKSVGKHFSVSQMQNPSVHHSFPWSSAFISYLFFKAGATKSQFPFSAAHSTYFQFAKRNRNNKNAPLRGFRINEYAPNLGDIVVNTRQSGFGYDTSGHFPSHGELVVEVGKGYIKTIGGNVGNSVQIRTFKTNAKGFLEGNRVPFFMVIQNNIR